MARAVQTAIDSLNFFVESRNHGNIISVTATISAPANSGDLTNTIQRGGLLFFTLSSVSVSSATIQVAINAKDETSGVYFPYIKASIDGLTPTTAQGIMLIYVGAVSAGLDFNPAIPNSLITLPLPHIFQVVTSMTISSTTATNSGTASLSIDYEKIM